MNLTTIKQDLRNYRNWINELQQDLIDTDLLILNSTLTTFPDLIIRRNRTVRQISTFKLMIKILKEELNTLSRA